MGYPIQKIMVKESKKIRHISEYFFSKKIKEIYELEKKGKKIINLGIGNPDLLPPNGVIHKMKLASDLNHANSYQSYIGIKNLRYAISNWYKKIYGVCIDPEKEILPLMGSKEGIMHISMCYLDKGDQVLVPNPGYPTYSSVSKLLGAEIIYYNLFENENWLPNLSFLEKKNLKKVKIIWVNYPHMPTGATIGLKKLEEIVHFSIKHNILLVYDNPYSFFCIKDNRFSIFNIKDAETISIELNSLSKSYNMPGWRVGMLVGKNEFIKNVLKVKSQMDSGMYYPIQIGAIEAMSHHSKKWIQKINEEYTKRRKVIWKICDFLNLRYQKNHSGIFIWAKLNHNDFEKDDQKWSDNFLYKYYIFVTPGRIFGTNGKGYLRFSICCPIEILEEAKNRIFFMKI